MATDELVLCRLDERLGHVRARPIARMAGTLLARVAITAVLAVCGSALLLIVLAVLHGAPLAVVAGITVASWLASARVVADLERS